MTAVGLLPPHLLDRLGDLEIIARTVVHGFVTGLHRSPFKGSGLDLHGHRPYQQGDQPRAIDWRLFGRSDRLFVREYREEANLQSLIVVDASASMGYAETGGLTKLRYAAILGAALAHIMLSAGDAIGLINSGGKPATLVPVRSRRGQLHDLLIALERLRPEGSASVAHTLERAGELLRRRGRVLVLSDLLDDDDGRALTQRLGWLRARGHEVIVLRPLTPTEAGRKAGESGRFFDPERPAREIPASLTAGGVLAHRVDAYYDRLTRVLSEHGIEYVPFWTTDPVELALRAWLAARRD